MCVSRVGIAWVAIAAACSSGAAAAELREALEQGSRSEKVAALAEFEKQTRLPSDLVAPLWTFVESEIATLERPLELADEADAVPLLADETPLAQLLADPAKHADRKHTLVGSIRVSNSYRGPAAELARSHLALEFTPLDERGKPAGARAYAYLPRSFGGLLLERLATRPSGPATRAIVRLEAALLTRDPRDANLLVATDWQLLHEGAWSEWEFAGLRAAFRVLPKGGRGAVPGLVELLADPAPKRPPTLAATLRTMCLGTLLNLEVRDRRQAASLLERKADAAKTAEERARLTKALVELRQSLAR